MRSVLRPPRRLLRAPVGSRAWLELLAAGGFLLHQFLSAGSNRRTDGYGGDVAGRARILVETIAGIRAAAADLAVSVRIGPGRKDDYELALDDLLEVAKLSTAAGASCVNVAIGAEMLARTDHVSIASPGQVKRPLEPVVKGAVSVPVIGGGGLLDMTGTEQLVASGSVDLVAMGRRIITDPKLPAKLFEGRASDIRPCIRCNVCLGRPPEPVMAGLAGEGRTGVGRKVLLAEDNPVNQVVAARLLERRGHQVTVAANGLDAVAAVEREAFDLVLMDVQMPEMDGFEATAAIRKAETRTGRHLPIFALTARAMKGDAERCLLAGMDGYLPKPINSADLYAIVNGGLPTPVTESTTASAA